MIEGRAIIKDLEKARQTALKLGGVFKGQYAYKDIVFLPKDKGPDLHHDCVKMRIMRKKNWDTKDVILQRKTAAWKGNAKKDTVSLWAEFDTQEEAEGFLKKRFGNKFVPGFEYSRKGWEYLIGNAKLYIENIEKLGPSIEIETEDIKDLDLFDRFGIIELLKDSVPEHIRKIFKRV